MASAMAKLPLCLPSTWRLVCLLAISTSAPADSLLVRDVADSIVIIRAVAADGSESLGSGVVIGTDTVATASHVIRGARTIETTYGAERRLASVTAGSVVHDLYLINVPDIGLHAVAIRSSQTLRQGERVVAAGFPRGGDLVDAEGRLVGLLAFKARTGMKLQFALPVEWVLEGGIFSSRRDTELASGDRVAFRERSRATQPSFLGNAMLEAANKR